MRLHHLRVSAFGPFADTVEVDLDELSDAGLFLLSGPTGAGKTSVLDAICFALYGDVPGDRAQARALRCDRAAPDLAPRVELEVTLAGRRLRLVRSPAWDRPKRRGGGTTRQQASVTVAERVDGAWRPLTSRLDEAGHLVADLLGMTLTQFTQVALLPQGRFQAFLRARSEERHALLARLFRTGRFEDVERWLRERRVELRRDSDGHHRSVADLVSRVSEAAGEPVPPRWRAGADESAVGGTGTGAAGPREPSATPAAAGGRGGALDLRCAADDGSLAAWAHDHLASAVEAAAAAGARADDAARLEAAARTEAERVRTLRAGLERLARARAEQATLDAEAGAHADRVEVLDAARRAAAVAPVQRRADEAGAEAAAADAAAHSAVAEIADDLAVLVVEREEVARRRQAAEEAATALRDALARGARLPLLTRRRSEAAARLAVVGAELDTARRAHHEGPQRVAELERAALGAREAAAALPALDVSADALRSRVAAHAEATRLAGELEPARAAWLDARQGALARHEELLAVRQARIEGMAAELAVGLVVGACCPVCGSDDHPEKAAATPDAPDARAEREAQRRLDDARATELVHDQRVRDLTTRLSLARGRAAGAGGPGGARGDDPHASAAADPAGCHAAGPDSEDPAALQRRLQAMERERADLAATAAAAEQADRRLAAAREEAGLLAERAAGLEADAAALEEALAHLATEHSALLGDLRAVLQGPGDAADQDQAGDPADDAHLLAALEAARAAHARCAERCRRAEAALDAAAAATRSAEAAGRALVEVVADAGFGSGRAAVAAAAAAVRPAGEVSALEHAVAHHRERRAAVEAVLASPDLDAVRGLSPGALPDLSEVEAQHARAHDRLGTARAEAASGATRAARLRDLVADVDAALARWAPVRTQLSTVAGLASFCEGRSPDNRLQVRLSAYVLSHRLTQVVAAANERLARMTGRRYALEHSGRRGAGETRGGLSLRVRDDWSGESRDPVTLSGGETFVVALALALGLADVIAHEAGGAELDTLFVDEGFGSLDADTLDEVMDVLDALRDGGRVVGVVSHVAEVRERVPTRLEVVKDRGGSRVRTVRG